MNFNNTSYESETFKKEEKDKLEAGIRDRMLIDNKDKKEDKEKAKQAADEAEQRKREKLYYKPFVISNAEHIYIATQTSRGIVTFQDLE